MAPPCSVCTAGSNPIGCLEVEPGSGGTAPALQPPLGLVASPAKDAVLAAMPSEQRVHDIVLKQALAEAEALTPLGPVRLAERKHIVGGLKAAFDRCATQLMTPERRRAIWAIYTSKASLELDQIQDKRGIWFCGTYLGCGFHEDGLKAGKAAAQSLLGKKIGPLANPKHMVLSWTETGARLLVLRFLNQYISIGNLILFEEGGTMFSFGEACEKKCNVKSVLRVQDPLFYWKVATEADLGLADAYINGCFSFINKREDFLNLFLILIANSDPLPVGLVDMRELKQGADRYFRYMGSLTAPPCTENIIWNIFAEVFSLQSN